MWGTRHVAIIREYYGDGTAMLYDANSGNGQTRVHRRRIAALNVADAKLAYGDPLKQSAAVATRSPCSCHLSNIAALPIGQNEATEYPTWHVQTAPEQCSFCDSSCCR